MLQKLQAQDMTLRHLLKRIATVSVNSAYVSMMLLPQRATVTVTIQVQYADLCVHYAIATVRGPVQVRYRTTEPYLAKHVWDNITGKYGG